MSLSLPPDSPAENRLKWVHRWSVEAPLPASNNGSIICRLTKECISMFRHLLKQISKDSLPSPCAYQRYDKSCSSLILWEQDYGIISGELDTTLEKSKTLRLSLLESLISIGKTLTGKIIMLLNQADDMSQSREALTLVLHEAEIYIQNGCEESSVLSDGDSDASSTACDDWLDIADDLWTDVQCLLDLQPIIETPILTIATKSYMSKPQLAELKPHTAYTDKISNRYPEADPKLIDRLARANWVRFLETKSSRDQNLSLGWVKGAINETQGKMKPPISEHPSTFHDSGIGSSAPNLSLYAETVMSYHQSERESVRVPPLPEGAKNGMPFDCIACGRNLVIRSNKRWKKHLYSDLHPWMCLDLQCKFGETAFEKRQDWVDHLALDHKLASDWKGFSCPLCHEALDDGQDKITRHLSAHLEEISLSAIPAAVESDHDSDSTSDTNDDEVKPAGRTLIRDGPSIAEPNNLGPFRNRKKITHEQWEAKRPIIADLYVRRQMTLKEVMKRLESNYGFIAAESGYKARIRKWNLPRKNISRRRRGRDEESSSSLSSDDYPIRHEQKKHENRRPKKSIPTSHDDIETTLRVQRGEVRGDDDLCLHGARDMTAEFDRLRTEGANQLEQKNDGPVTSRDDGFTPTRPLPKGAEVSQKIILASQLQVPDYSISGSGAQSHRGADEVPPNVPSRVLEAPANIDESSTKTESL